MRGFVWDEKKIERLRILFPDNLSSVVAKKLKCPLSTVSHKACLLGIKKSEHHKNVTLKKISRKQANHPAMKANRFRKGIRLPHQFMPEKGYHAPGSEKGWFPKGHIPDCTLYDGAITIRTDHKDRKGRQQKWIRLGNAKWQELQHYNWEKKYGKIPGGMILRCKSEDTLNCNPSNWRLITKAENKLLNSNYKKMGETMKREYYGPMKDLDKDKRVAFYLFPNDPQKQKEALKNEKLLEAKRLELKLKRTIKNVIGKQTGENEGQVLHVQAKRKKNYRFQNT